MKKRILTLSLTIIAMMALLTVSASAVDVSNISDLNSNLASGNDVTLTTAIDGDVVVPASVDVEIDLAGFTLTGTGKADASKVIQVEKGATLTLKSSVAGGTVSTSQGYALFNDGTVTIEGSNVSLISTDATASLIRNGEVNDTTSPKLTIEGGTFTGGMNNMVTGTHSTTYISGGTFSGYSRTAGTAAILCWGTATITGDTVIDATSTYTTVNACGDSGDVTITGGTYTGMLLNNVKVSGGSFSVNPIAFVVTGYTTSYDDSIYTVIEATSVAYINGQGYDTVAEAITAAGNTETAITLTGNSSESVSPFTIPSNVTLTINSGVTLAASDTITNNGTIINNGTITCTTGYNNATFINNGTVTVAAGFNFNAAGVFTNNATLSINSTIYIKEGSGGQATFVSGAGASTTNNNSTIYVYGATSLESACEFTGASKIQVYATIELDEDVTIPEGTQLYISSASYSLTIPENVTLTIDGTLYIYKGAITNNGTLTVAGDTTLGGAGTAYGKLYNYGTATFNGDVTLTANSSNSYCGTIDSYGSLTFNGALTNAGTITVYEPVAVASGGAVYTALSDTSMVATAVSYDEEVVSELIINDEVINTGTITVEDDATITVGDGATLTNEGTIDLSSATSVTIDGTITNNGEIDLSSTTSVTISGTITNEGTLDLTSATGVTITGTIENNDTIILPSTTNAADEETFANITGTGTVQIGTTTYDNEGNTAIVVGDFTISGEDLTEGTDYSYTGNTLTILSDKAMTITGTTSSNVISIQAATSSLTLKDLTITTDGTAITVGTYTSVDTHSTFDVTIIGEGDISITAKNGISSYTTGSLTISDGDWTIDTSSSTGKSISANGVVTLSGVNMDVTGEYVGIMAGEVKLTNSTSLDVSCEYANGTAIETANTSDDASDGGLSVDNTSSLTADSDVYVLDAVDNSGTITVGEDATLDLGGTLTNNAGATLTIEAGATLTNSSTITNNGTIELPTGTDIADLNITGDGTVEIDGTSYENDGTVIVVSSGSSGSSSYSSSVASTSNGDVSVSSSKSSSGTTVTITAEPDDGYVVGEVTVTYSSGKEVSVTDNGDGTYSYIQPGAAVTVTVTFVDPDAVEEEEILADEASGFYDVDSDAYYYDAMLWALDEGITTGYSDDTFRPTTSCTRAQVVTFLWRAAGEPTATIDNPFSDLDEDAYYYQAVLWAVENDITTGYADGTFGAGNTCTRGQIVTFMFRMDGEDGTDNADPMTDMVDGAYYYDAALWAIDQGITTGYSDGTFQATTLCNRGQIVTFLYRYLAD